MANAWFNPGDATFAPAALPVRLAEAAVIDYGGKIYTFGGQTYDGTDGYAWATRTFTYDPSTNAWTEGERDPAAVTADPYDPGNWYGARMTGARVGTTVYLATYEVFGAFDLTTMTWSGMLGDLPGAGSNVQRILFSIDSTLYVYRYTGGTSEVYSYDAGTDAWSLELSGGPGVSNSEANVAVTGSKAYFAESTFAYVFDPSGPSSTAFTAPASGSRRRDAMGTAFGGKMYIPGGRDTTLSYPDNYIYYDTMQEYDPAGDSWSAISWLLLWSG